MKETTKEMKHLLIILAVVFGISIITISCEKAEEVKVEKTENARTNTSKNTLASTMKRASGVMRRLSRAVEGNDWVEIEMWTQELKEGIGYHCVELYMIENNVISSDFIISSNKFNNAINKLILSGKEHDVNVAHLEFSSLIKSCDTCHEKFYEKVGRQMEFTDQIRIFLNNNDGVEE